MGLSIVFLLVLLVVAAVVIPMLARVFRQAADRNPNTLRDRGNYDRSR